jgi:hypothetical protein
MPHALQTRYIGIGQRHKGARHGDGDQLLQRCLHDGGLHRCIVWRAGISTHGHAWRDGARCPTLSGDGRQRGDQDSRNASGLNCSLHNHGRAVARASASRHDHGVYVLGAQELRDGRPCDLPQHLDIAPSPHQADVRGCDLFDHPCFS